MAREVSTTHAGCGFAEYHARGEVEHSGGSECVVGGAPNRHLKLAFYYAKPNICIAPPERVQ